MSQQVGYAVNFLGTAFAVPLPDLNEDFRKDLAPVSDDHESIAKYFNYSLKLCASRRFPYFTASNIDGKLFKKASRAKSWKKDPRIDKGHQWGEELYKATKSDFDKGHMTKREDVQWGKTILQAQKAADQTFFYSNAVPQHADLNQQIWKSLEDYILHTETNQKELKVCVFTGPALRPDDPLFVTRVGENEIQIPALFWKVVYFTTEEGKLKRVGFLMSQRKLLLSHEITRDSEFETGDELFMQFDDADTYQVNISLIEELAGISLPKAEDPFHDQRSKKLVLREVEVGDEELESDSPVARLGFIIENIEL